MLFRSMNNKIVKGVILALLIISTVLIFGNALSFAEGLDTSGSSSNIWAYVALAVIVTGGSFAAAYAVSTVGCSAIGVMAEKPDLFGRVLVFVGLAEGIAIYGLIIGIMILSKI